ncbi:hypothetical protein DHEL01_v203079 [Diaporthe helianthi]|uniref:Uncharacterized protein n=1 Tax=Diaporthe helianthi TaxID=158607 RepID=A0A2P5I7P0_DIAHE|nr:hypothetical protein DHEL01_v203079 [Diaporthe helianthi]
MLSCVASSHRLSPTVHRPTTVIRGTGPQEHQQAARQPRWAGTGTGAGSNIVGVHDSPQPHPLPPPPRLGLEVPLRTT